MLVARGTRGIVHDRPRWAEEFPIGTEVVLYANLDMMTLATVVGYAENPEYVISEKSDWPYEQEPIYAKKEGAFFSVLLYDKTELLVPFSDVSRWSASKREDGVVGRLLCAFGIHAWEKHVAKRGLVRDGLSFGGWVTFADQDGLQSCERAGCRAERKVSRSGIRYCNKDMKWQPVRG